MNYHWIFIEIIQLVKSILTNDEGTKKLSCLSLFKGSFVLKNATNAFYDMNQPCKEIVMIMF